VLAGPTGSGKTLLAVELAEKIGAEIISADSRQIYKYLPIGTAQPSVAQLKTIPHHCVNFLDPALKYSAGQFARDASAVIRKLQKKHKRVILAGGTGLYINALIDGLSPIPPIKDVIKQELFCELETSGIACLYKKLAKADPAIAKVIHPAHSSRIIRALEVYRGTGKPISYWHSIKPKKQLKAAHFGLQWDKKELHELLMERIKIMLMRGMIKETKILINKGYPNNSPGLLGLGYQNVIQYLNGSITRNKMAESIYNDTKAYAKRQMTWFGRDNRINWILMNKTKRNAIITGEIINILMERKIL